MHSDDFQVNGMFKVAGQNTANCLKAICLKKGNFNN